MMTQYLAHNEIENLSVGSLVTAKATYVAERLVFEKTDDNVWVVSREYNDKDSLSSFHQEYRDRQFFTNAWIYYGNATIFSKPSTITIPVPSTLPKTCATWSDVVNIYKNLDGYTSKIVLSVAQAVVDAGYDVKPDYTINDIEYYRENGYEFDSNDLYPILPPGTLIKYKTNVFILDDSGKWLSVDHLESDKRWASSVSLLSAVFIPLDGQEPAKIIFLPGQKS